MSGVKTLGLLLVWISTGSTLECYSCADVDFGPCHKPKILQASTSTCATSVSNTTSSSGGFLCYAVHLTLSVDANVVERGCVREQPSEDFCRRLSILGDGIHEVKSCELCDDDLCNSGAFALGTLNYCLFLSLSLGVQLIMLYLPAPK